MLAWEFSGSFTDGLGRMAHNRPSGPEYAQGWRARWVLGRPEPCKANVRRHAAGGVSERR